MSKENQLRELIDLIKYKTGLTQAEIAEKSGYKRAYLSQVLGMDQPPVKLITKLKLTFKDVLKNEHLDSVLRETLANEEQPNILPTSKTYREKLRDLKNSTSPFLVPLVPVAAQAGYAKNFYDMAYIEKLDTYPIVPGIDHHGASWRYFQVKGKSMEETFKEGQFLLASQVLKEDWRNIENFYVYVIVTDEGVVIKRLAKVKGKDYWAAISDNDVEFSQFKLPVSDVKELWKYRRHIEWDASPPKKFEIKV